METALFTKVFGDRTLAEAVDLTAEVGYDAVELMCREPHFGVDTTVEEAAELKARVEDRGIEIAALGTYTGDYVGGSDATAAAEREKLEKFLELADVLEVDLLRHGVGGPPEHRAEPGHYEEAAERYRRAADLAADYGKTLGIEIHAGTITETAASTAELIDAVDRENVGAIHDAGNMYIVDTPFGPESVETLGDRLVHVHVKDERRVGDTSEPGTFEVETARGEEAFQHRLLGHGAVDHSGLFAALAGAGYDGYLTNECHCPTGEVWSDLAVADHERSAMEQLL